jgi:nucleotide-binding universal stress UspA family protein
MSFTRILCPVDLSPLSACIVRQAIAHAEGSDARIHVIHAVEPLLLQAATMTRGSQALRHEIDVDLQRIIADAMREVGGAPPIETSIAEGAPEQAILAASAADRSDLIVMGLHGMSALSKACFGSTLERVLRTTTTPVLALPAALDAGAIKCPPWQTTHVIAAIDFQQASMAAARLAADYARRHDAALTLLHVMPPAPMWGNWRDAVSQQHRMRRGRAEDELVALADELSQRHRPATIDVREGQPWEQIAACGSERPGSLVVMGLGPSARAFARPGSVAWRVLSLGLHPVLAAPLAATPRESVRRQHAAREAYTETTETR